MRHCREVGAEIVAWANRTQVERSERRRIRSDTARPAR